MSTIKSSNEHLTLNADGSSKDIKLQANASEKVIVKSDGKVGIGVTSPAVTLELSGNGGALRLPSGGELQFADSANKIYGHSSNNYLRFDTNSTERMRVTDNGLTFNGDTAAANALDDYEEGSWTPAFIGSSGSAGSVAHSVQEGYYTKIGRLVTCQFNLTLTNRGSWSGEARLTGLPFDPADTFPAAGSVSLDNVNVPDDASGHDVYVNPGVTYFRFYYTQDFASRTFVLVSQVTDAADFNGTISYIV